MIRPISEDIVGYKDDFFKGLSKRECAYGATAFSVGVGSMLVLVFRYKFSINLAVTIAVPLIALIGFCGFYEKDQMTFPQIIKRALTIKRQKPLIYETGTLNNLKPKSNQKVGWIERILIRMQKRKENQDE